MADCVPVLYPTEADMQRPFEEYIESIEAEAWDYGIAIIQPPPSWSPRGPVPSRVSPRHRSGAAQAHPGRGAAAAAPAVPAAPGRAASGTQPADQTATGRAASAPAQAGAGATAGVEAEAGAAAEPLPGAGYVGPDGRDLDDWIIPQPIRQHAAGSKGVFLSIHVVESKGIPVREFREMAMAPQNCPPPAIAQDPLSLERAFWKNVTHSPPLYGADGVGSLFSASRVKEWNVAKLGTMLSRRLEAEGRSIPGVTTAYLYFGMWRSVFAWHTEDMDLYSVNYLHFGKPKSWYVVPPAHRFRFERLAQSLAPNQYKACSQFLRHKETLISPHLLQQNSIPFFRAVQKPGQFVINFPGVYHAGFNQGYNCAESTNFATKRWIDLGLKARPCACRCDSVTIDMSLFLDSPSDCSTPSPPHLSPIGTPEEDASLVPSAHSLTSDVSTALATKARPKSKSKSKTKVHPKAQAAAGPGAKKSKPPSKSAAAQGGRTAPPESSLAAGGAASRKGAPTAGAKRKGAPSSGGAGAASNGPAGPVRPAKKARKSSSLSAGSKAKKKSKSRKAPAPPRSSTPAAGAAVAQGPGGREAGGVPRAGSDGLEVAGRVPPLARAQQRRADLAARLAQAAPGSPGTGMPLSSSLGAEGPAVDGLTSPADKPRKDTRNGAVEAAGSLFQGAASGMAGMQGVLLAMPAKKPKGGQAAATGQSTVLPGGVPTVSPLPTASQPQQRKAPKKAKRGGAKGVQLEASPASGAPAAALDGPVPARCASCRRWRSVAPHHFASVLEQTSQQGGGGSAAQLVPRALQAQGNAPRWAAAFRCAMLPGLTCRTRTQATEEVEGASASSPGAPVTCHGPQPSAPGGAATVVVASGQQNASATLSELEAQLRLHACGSAQPSHQAPEAACASTLQNCTATEAEKRAGPWCTLEHPSRVECRGGSQGFMAIPSACHSEDCSLPVLEHPLEGFVARMPDSSGGLPEAQARGVPRAWEPRAGHTQQIQGVGGLSRGLAVKQGPLAEGYTSGATGGASASASPLPRQVVEVVGREASAVVLALPAAVPKPVKAQAEPAQAKLASALSPSAAGARTSATRLQRGRTSRAPRASAQPEEHRHSTLSLGEPVADALFCAATPNSPSDPGAAEEPCCQWRAVASETPKPGHIPTEHCEEGCRAGMLWD